MSLWSRRRSASLAVVAGVGEVAIGRQHEGGQRAREERGPILPRVVGGDEEEGLVLDERRRRSSRRTGSANPERPPG